MPRKQNKTEIGGNQAFFTDNKASICIENDHVNLKGQYHAIFSNTLKIEKTLFG